MVAMDAGKNCRDVLGHRQAGGELQRSFCSARGKERVGVGPLRAGWHGAGFFFVSRAACQHMHLQ